jgi:hypothetical protein
VELQEALHWCTHGAALFVICCTMFMTFCCSLGLCRSDHDLLPAESLACLCLGPVLRSFAEPTTKGAELEGEYQTMILTREQSKSCFATPHPKMNTLLSHMGNDLFCIQLADPAMLAKLCCALR